MERRQPGIMKSTAAATRQQRRHPASAKHLVDTGPCLGDQILRKLRIEMRRHVLRKSPVRSIMSLLLMLRMLLSNIVLIIMMSNFYSLQSIDMSQVRHDDIPLIHHHAQCEEAEEQ